MIKGTGKGKGKGGKKGMAKLGYSSAWDWWGNDWQGSADWNNQGMTSLSLQHGGQSWMRRLCPLYG